MSAGDGMHVGERKLYTTIDGDGEPHGIFTGYEAAAHEAAITLHSVQELAPAFQVRGAVKDAEDLARCLAWALHPMGTDPPALNRHEELLARYLPTSGGQS